MALPPPPDASTSSPPPAAGPLSLLHTIPENEQKLLVEMAQRLDIPAVDTTILEPLCDPLTLLRFLRARDGNVDAAVKMYTSTMKWRATKLHGLMQTYGCDDESQYAPTGIRSTPATTWTWRRRTEGNPQAELMQKIGFFGRLSVNGPDDAPVAIWRLGKCDLYGIRDNNLVESVCDAFAVHLEDLFQAGRAASLKNKKMVRARLIVDVSGAGLKMVPLLKTLKAIIGVGKEFFPEVTASATIINTPWVFSTLWALVTPLLTKVMQAKVCLLGSSWNSGDAGDFTAHSGMQISDLPTFLGGNLPDSEIGLCEPVSACL
mmetsp:Transcript_21484/g.44790  ORF Transcript_21484/g.44790 Transcript_21484/m.44790 type:complete len:318 (-) Transcript_21484:45-998(-)